MNHHGQTLRGHGSPPGPGRVVPAGRVVDIAGANIRAPFLVWPHAVEGHQRRRPKPPPKRPRHPPASPNRSPQPPPPPNRSPQPPPPNRSPQPPLLWLMLLKRSSPLAPGLLFPVGPRRVARRALPSARRVLLPAAAAVLVDVAVVVGVDVVALAGRAVGLRLARASGSCRSSGIPAQCPARPRPPRAEWWRRRRWSGSCTSTCARPRRPGGRRPRSAGACAIRRYSGSSRWSAARCRSRRRPWVRFGPCGSPPSRPVRSPIMLVAYEYRPVDAL